MTVTRWSAVRDKQVPDDVDRLLATVPEWFGQPDSRAEYVDDSRTMETWTVRNEVGAVIGVTLVTRHFAHTAEIHLIVVDRAAHGTGVGTTMVVTIESELRHSSVRLLQVKTLGASQDDPNCARTRHFYKKMGFLPLGETNLWGEATPCLIMVKPLT